MVAHPQRPDSGVRRWICAESGLLCTETAEVEILGDHLFTHSAHVGLGLGLSHGVPSGRNEPLDKAGAPSLTGSPNRDRPIATPSSGADICSIPRTRENCSHIGGMPRAKAKNGITRYQ